MTAETHARASGRTAHVMAQIRSRIASGALTNGDRLPSIRGFAASLGVSPSTVVEAYDRLAAEGLIRARAGSGFFVTANTLSPVALSTRDESPELREVDPFWVSRQSLDADDESPKPGCGWLPADWMPQAALRRALRNVARAEDAVLLNYGRTQGDFDLRRLLARRAAEEGLALDPANIMLTGSGSQSIDLICRLLLKPGDTVLVDDPCYFNFRALLKAHQVQVISVAMTPTGPDLTAFENALQASAPCLYLTNSALHNPTGATLSPPVAHRLLKLAEAHDLLILEDDIFTDFEPEPSVRLAALDGLNRVIRIGSFSKTLSASLRCGYIAARAEWIEGLVDLQIAAQFGGPSPIVTHVIGEVLTGGSYRKHMEEVRRRLNRTRRSVSARLTTLGIEPWLEPRGGFYLWCQLPEGVSSTALAQAAMAEGVVMAPGNVFSAAQTASRFMRFNVAQMADEKSWQVLERECGVRRQG
ncbi:aminotransferase-like domain-containing protein [Rhizobium rhizoryzae]|uniref:aminotransferase-like domain-containing protein n=1 Tax=Rhizobium rhizoryzae TaxID=451876 RepID=UPI00289DC8F9|nr:PLP-dependent aminotransferase family protein [Rhizobium rhizoryzae]